MPLGSGGSPLAFRIWLCKGRPDASASGIALNRNRVLWLAASFLLAGCQAPDRGVSVQSVSNDTPSYTVGLVLPFTGAEADYASHIKNGVVMAIDEVNAVGGVGGVNIKLLALDSANGGQYDPARAAGSARTLAGDSTVVAVIGPMMSGEGKAMSPILSEANLATVTPSSTN